MAKNSFLLIVILGLFLSAKCQWSLTGNSIASGNFIGTTNNLNLQFKVNNINAGLLDVTAKNTFFGIYSGGNVVPTSSFNSAFGYGSLQSITSGSSIVAIGCLSLNANTTGNSNTGVGFQSMYKNQVGSSNTAAGGNSLYSLNPSSNPTLGVLNCSFGVNSLFSSLDGSYNSVLGSNAMFNTTGCTGCSVIGFRAGYGTGSNGGYYTAAGSQALYNITATGGAIALGYQSQYSLTTGQTDDISVGYQSLYSNKTSNDNIGIGYQTLFFTTGTANGQGNNIAVGYSSLYNNTSTPNNNTNLGIGGYSLYNNTSGFYNTAFGYGAMYNNSTVAGNDNVGIGYGALGNNTIGTNNTAIGSGAGPSLGNLSNTIAVGTNAVPTTSNEAVFGNTTTTIIGGFVSWTTISDGRFKKSIKENIPGLTFITNLRPVAYTLDVHALNNFIYDSGESGPTMENSLNSAKDETAVFQKENINYSGFISQEVEIASKKINYSFSGIIKPSSEKDIYRLRYSDFIPSLCKAVVEMKNRNDSLVNMTTLLGLLLDKIQLQLDSIKSSIKLSSVPETDHIQDAILTGQSIHETTDDKIINQSLNKKLN